jgi:hypothetical protein
VTNSNLAADRSRINPDAQPRRTLRRALAYAFGLAIPRRLRAAWRREFLRRWDAEDNAPIVLAYISAKVVARPAPAVPEPTPAEAALVEPEGNPHEPRGPPPDLIGMAGILFPNMSPEMRAIVAAGGRQQ